MSTPAGGPTSPHPRTVPHATHSPSQPHRARQPARPLPPRPCTTHHPRPLASFLVGASRAQPAGTWGPGTQCSSPASGAPLVVCHGLTGLESRNRLAPSRRAENRPLRSFETRGIWPTCAENKLTKVGRGGLFDETKKNPETSIILHALDMLERCGSSIRLDTLMKAQIHTCSHHSLRSD